MNKSESKGRHIVAWWALLERCEFACYGADQTDSRSETMTKQEKKGWKANCSELGQINKFEMNENGDQCGLAEYETAFGDGKKCKWQCQRQKKRSRDVENNLNVNQSKRVRLVQV